MSRVPVANHAKRMKTVPRTERIVQVANEIIRKRNIGNGKWAGRDFWRFIVVSSPTVTRCIRKTSGNDAPKLNTVKYRSRFWYGWVIIFGVTITKKLCASDEDKFVSVVFRSVRITLGNARLKRAEQSANYLRPGTRPLKSSGYGQTFALRVRNRKFRFARNQKKTKKRSAKNRRNLFVIVVRYENKTKTSKYGLPDRARTSKSSRPRDNEYLVGAGFSRRTLSSSNTCAGRSGRARSTRRFFFINVYLIFFFL